jgi:D-methionine transport system ATP-binding protein
LIELKNIHKSYASRDKVVEALAGVSLDIAQGEIFGIIGRSGAGKSTLIRMLNLLERPTSGSVLLHGQDITKISEAALRTLRHKIGMVFQHFNLLTSRTVLQNVAFPLRLAGMDNNARTERALALLELVGLQDHAYKYPRQLSGGQQQRVGIARALANEPELLLCDEATSALDPETTQSILNLVLDINRRFGITVVLITHSMDVIRSVCDRVAIIDNGRIAESGEVVEVFLHPQHATTLSLLSESGVDADGWKELIEGVPGRIVRLTYRGHSTARPLLSQASRDLDVNLSILQGAVGKIKDTPYGQLVLAVDADPSRYEPLEVFFRHNQVNYEVLRA